MNGMLDSSPPSLDLPFHDRHHAGRRLAGRLEHYRDSPALLVLALAPGGGVAVALEVARSLQAALDVLVVQPLSLRGTEGAAASVIGVIASIASRDVRIMNPLPGQMMTAANMQLAMERERLELARREQFYRLQRPVIAIGGRTVIVVDDGLATGSLMQATLLAVRQQHPLQIIAAVPVGDADSCEALSLYADDVVCAAKPQPFGAVRDHYQRFPIISDEEISSWLDDARHEHAQRMRSLYATRNKPGFTSQNVAVESLQSPPAAP